MQLSFTTIVKYTLKEHYLIEMRNAIAEMRIHIAGNVMNTKFASQKYN